jgi:uncharacterized protein YjbI with pentapeptide repeats
VDFSNFSFPQHADLSNTNLQNANLSGVSAVNETFDDSYLKGANLSGGIFKGSSMQAVDLTNATLGSADFTKVALVSPNTQNLVELKGTNWTGVTMTGIQSRNIDTNPTALPSGWAVIRGFIVGPTSGSHWS